MLGERGRMIVKRWGQCNWKGGKAAAESKPTKCRSCAALGMTSFCVAARWDGLGRNKLFLARIPVNRGVFKPRICLTLVGVRRRIAAQKFVGPGCDSGRECLPMRVIRFTLIAILLLSAGSARAQRLREIPRITTATPRGKRECCNVRKRRVLSAQQATAVPALRSPRSYF